MIITKKRRAKFFKALGFRRLPYLPFILGIETGNICNLRCPLCPTGAQEPGLENGFMDYSLFKKIFDQLNKSLNSINLYSWGEPLLNKDLVSMIRYSKTSNKNIKIITSTNLNIADKKQLEDLISSGIDEIIVSCDGANKESYIKYRVGGNFDLVMDNLRFLTEKKKELNKNTLIVWNFLVFRHNEYEVEKAKMTAHSLGVNFRIGLMRTSMKDEILKPHKESIEKDKDWIPDNPKYSAYDKERLITKKIIKTCRKPWQEISINWDGKVFPCCAVYGDRYSFGNIKDESIKIIWNNKNYLLARSEIIGGKKSRETICGICKSHGFMHM